MYDGDTEEIPRAEYRSVASLVGDFILIQRRIGVIKLRYEERRRTWLASLMDEQAIRSEYLAAEEEYHNLILTREKLNLAIEHIYRDLGPMMANQILRQTITEEEEQARMQKAEEDDAIERRWSADD